MKNLLKLALALSIVTTAALSGLSEERSKRAPKPEKPQKPVVDKDQFGQWLDKDGYVTEGPKIKNWIDTDRDRIDDRLQPGPGKPSGKKRPVVGKPEPRPGKPKPPKPGVKPGEPNKPTPEKPTRPTRPEPPEDVKANMDTYKEQQQQLQKALRSKIEQLGKKPSKEAIRKVVTQFQEDNANIIDSQKQLGREIHEWNKQNRPTRPERPKPTAEVTLAIEHLKSKQNALAESRKKLLEDLKDTNKQEREALLKEYKLSQQKHLDELKEASKALRELNRTLPQTGDRRR